MVGRQIEFIRLQRLHIYSHYCSNSTDRKMGLINILSCPPWRRRWCAGWRKRIGLNYICKQATSNQIVILELNKAWQDFNVKGLKGANSLEMRGLTTSQEVVGGSLLFGAIRIIFVNSHVELLAQVPMFQEL